MFTGISGSKTSRSAATTAACTSSGSGLEPEPVSRGLAVATTGSVGVSVSKVIPPLAGCEVV